MNWLRAIFLLILSTILLGACGGASEPAENTDPKASEAAVQPAPAPAVEAAPLEEGPAEAEPDTAPAPVPQRKQEAKATPVRRPAPAAESRRDPKPAPTAAQPPTSEPSEEAFPEYEPPEPTRTPRADEQPVVVPSPPRGPQTTAPASDAGTTVTPPPPARRLSVVVPEGTSIEVRLAERLDSSRNQDGDRFQAILERDLEVNGQVVARRGSRVIGVLQDVDPGGRVKGRAEMTLTLSRIEAGETRLEIETNPITIQAESSKAKDAKTIGIASGVGAAVGAILGGKKGAAIGAAVGGGAGAGRVLTSRGDEAVLEREQLLSFRLERDLEATVR